jgi:hypothetical protein
MLSPNVVSHALNTMPDMYEEDFDLALLLRVSTR